MARIEDRPAFPWAGARGAASIALAAIALALTPSAAFSSPSHVSSGAQASDVFEEEVEGEPEEEWEEGESEEGDGGWIELEGEEELEEGSTSSLPLGCLLRNVQPEAVLDATHETLRLALRYTSRTPTRVGLDLSLKGGKGSLQLAAARQQLARSGVLHLERHLDPRSLAKARAAHIALVKLDVPAAPSFCRPYLTLRLTARHVLGDRATWSVPLQRPHA